MSQQNHLQLNKHSISYPDRSLVVFAGLMILIIIILSISVTSGAYQLTFSQMVDIMLGGGDSTERMILFDNRLPRILCGLAAGAAFGISGAMFQTMLRNPLASPDVIGFSAGASLGALMAVVFLGSAFIVFGAIIGGFITALLIILLSWKNGIQPLRLILIGIGVGLTITACSDLLMSKIDVVVAADMTKWLVGTLNARNWQDVFLVWTGLIILIPFVCLLQFPLSRLSMNDDLVIALGIRLLPLRLAITLVGIGLVAIAISVAGPLPFVAFVSGPIARTLVGRGKPALGAAALIGAAVVLLSDLAARFLVPGIQLPAGVFTTLIGAPVLMWLLLLQFKKGNY